MLPADLTYIYIDNFGLTSRDDVSHNYTRLIYAPGSWSALPRVVDVVPLLCVAFVSYHRAETYCCWRMLFLCVCYSYRVTELNFTSVGGKFVDHETDLLRADRLYRCLSVMTISRIGPRT